MSSPWDDDDSWWHHQDQLMQELEVLVKDDGPQAQGSGLTYARRYALAAIVGLAQIDDDAEAATARNSVDPALTRKVAQCATLEELTALFKSLPEATRASHSNIFSNRRRELQ
jgi:hypothetical protein